MRRWIFFIVSAILLSHAGMAQNCEDGVSEEQLEDLIEKHGKHKRFDTALLLPALLALEHFPELSETNIRFKRKKIKTLMAARPELNFIFRKKENRRYTIFISTNAKNNSEPLLEEMSGCAQTGVLGHEFVHILSYENKSNFRLVLFAVSYPFKKKTVERETDMATIERGLGDQILDFNRHVYKSAYTSEQYLKQKTRNYLSISEIEQEVLNAF